MRPWALYLANGRHLAVARPLVMGIVNATPDSFSDGGEFAEAATFAKRLQTLVTEGADILDVGAESTRPGHVPVSAQEQIRRLEEILPIAGALGVPVSIDTRLAEVAAWALAHGAGFVNDVSALADRDMADVIRMAGCSVVIMRHQTLEGDVVLACQRELDERVAYALSVGIPESAILVDPGLGFGAVPGADRDANFRLIRELAIWSRGRPAVIGASRKRFVAEPGVSANQRVAGSTAAARDAVDSGAAIVRVHDVAATVAALA